MRHRASASLLLVWILPLTLVGCMSATIQESRELPTQIVDGEAVVLRPGLEVVADREGQPAAQHIGGQPVMIQQCLRAARGRPPGRGTACVCVEWS